MQFSIRVLLGFVALAAAGPLENRDACNADNCLRAVKNVAISVVASSDCSSFMTQTTTITVTPPASTVISKHTQTISVTLTTNAVVKISARGEVEKRSSIQSVPAFASACSSISRFSSACSCIGITAATVTHTYSLPVSTNTIVSSVTVTATTTLGQGSSIATSSKSSASGQLSTSSSTVTSTQPTASLDSLSAGQFYLQVIEATTNNSLGYILNDGVLGWVAASITTNPSDLYATCWFDGTNIKCSCPPTVSGYHGLQCHDYLAFGLKDYECEHNTMLGDTDYWSAENWFNCDVNPQSGFLSCTVPMNVPASALHFYSCGYGNDLSTRYVTYGGGSCNAGCVPINLFVDRYLSYGLYGS